MIIYYRTLMNTVTYTQLYILIYDDINDYILSHYNTCIS